MRHRQKGTLVSGSPDDDVGKGEVSEELTFANQLIQPGNLSIKQCRPREDGCRLRCHPLRVMALPVAVSGAHPRGGTAP